MQTSCIILAAGASTRFGSQNLLYPLGNGEPVLVMTIKAYQACFSDIVVVSTPGLQELVENTGGTYVESLNTARGMSQSLISGIQMASDSNAWMIALGDMPYVQSETLALLHKRANKHSIVVPVCNGQRGNPVIFGCFFKNELLSLTGDKGGKAILESYPDCVNEIGVTDSGVLHDIDDCFGATEIV